jgi:hypothetical protein
MVGQSLELIIMAKAAAGVGCGDAAAAAFFKFFDDEKPQQFKLTEPLSST